MCMDFGMSHNMIVCDGDRALVAASEPEGITARMRKISTVAEMEARHINRYHEDGAVFLSQRQDTCYNSTSDAAPTA